MIAGVSITSDSDGKLGFSAASLSHPSNAADTTDNLSIVHGGLGSQQIDIGSGTIEGKFLGIGLNGPLAVLGGWSIANTNSNIGAEVPTSYRAAGAGGHGGHRRDGDGSSRSGNGPRRVSYGP